tara:strand:+ start:1181 stop:3400 length:2220 start_codon:yes stop_codon:yes gene_type:complete
MDLADTPDGSQIVSQQIVIKPENQADISKSNGSRNVRFLIPDYLGYWMPSQSNFTFDIEMRGRGLPIPSRDAGLHSMFQTIRSHDGTGTHLLEEIVSYNTYVAQKFNYTKTEASNNNRSEFQGVQANQSYDNNLYWALDGGINWAGGTITKPLIPRKVQFVAPLQSKLYNTSEYIPCKALGGVRLELQLENYLRAIEYTTGSLGVKHGSTINGAMPFPLAIVENGTDIPVVGAQTIIDMFDYAGAGFVAGTGYVVGNLYSFAIGGVDCGYVKVLTAPGGVVSKAELFSLGMVGATSSTRIPVEGDLLTLSKQAAPDTACVLPLNKGVNGCGDGSISNHYQDIHMPMYVGDPAELAADAVNLSSTGAILSPLDTATSFGDGTLRSPYRNVSRRASAAYNPNGCYSTTTMPFEIGDDLYISTLSGTNEVRGCVVSGIDQYLTAFETPRLLMRPDRPVVAGLVLAAAAPNKLAQSPSPRVFLNNYGFTHLEDGYSMYVNDTDRIDGYTIVNIPTGTSELDTLHNSAANQVDFVLSDFQYQAQQVTLSDAVTNGDIAAANSEKGLQIDLQTTETRLVNVAQIQGPTSQLISIPNITRALGVLSVPLNQNEQRGLWCKSLRGVPDNLTNYQYELGQAGLVPNRPVPVSKASLGNPLVQAWEVNEKMKVMNSFDLVVSNLNEVGMNFGVGRQFSRPGMWYDLMKAGDLLLRCQYDEAQTSPKLFCHFLNHIRSININKGGMRISN